MSLHAEDGSIQAPHSERTFRASKHRGCGAVNDQHTQGPKEKLSGPLESLQLDVVSSPIRLRLSSWCSQSQQQIAAAWFDVTYIMFDRQRMCEGSWFSTT
eukprot:5311013-Amphidinium_carterae.2